MKIRPRASTRGLDQQGYDSLSAPASRSQPANFGPKLIDFLLLLFDGIEHGPEDRVIINLQVTVFISGYRFRNNVLYRLSAKANVFGVRFEAERCRVCTHNVPGSAA